MNKEIAEQMWNHALIVESIIHLGGIGDWEVLPDSLIDFFELASNEDFEEFFGMSMKKLEELNVFEMLEDGDSIGEFLRYKCDDRLGYFVHFTTPIMTPDITDITSDGMYSWGTRRVKWFYGENLFDAYNKGFVWSHRERISEKQRLIHGANVKPKKIRKAERDLADYETLEKYKPYQIPDSTIITCVYCGHEYPIGTPTAKAKLLTEHIAQCSKHPMSALIRMTEDLNTHPEGYDGPCECKECRGLKD